MRREPKRIYERPFEGPLIVTSTLKSVHLINYKLSQLFTTVTFILWLNQISSTHSAL